MKPLFGLSLRTFPEELFKAPPEFCRMLELTGDALDEGVFRKAQRRCGSMEYGVRDLLDPMLSRRLVGADAPLLAEAMIKLSERAHMADKLGARWASLDVDAARAVEDPEYAAELRRILLTVGGALVKTGWREPLLLPVRIPAPGRAADPERLLKFRHELPIAGMRLVFELHPHEPGALEWGWRELLGFEARWWRLCFDPASGNRLSAGALSRFLEFSALAPEPPRVLFSPAAETDAFTLDQIAETVLKWGGNR